MRFYKTALLIFTLIFAFTLSNNAEAQSKNTLKIAKDVVKPGASVKVVFTTEKGLKKNAWIGIIPSSTKHGSEAENDKVDVAYQYLQGKVKGTLTFKAPTKPGKYDFRLNSTDDNGKELASVSFTVK